MSQIEAIEKLYAKKKTYKIPKEPKEGKEQVTLELTPLSLEDMSLLNMKEDMSLQEIAKNVQVMFSRSLGITEKEVSKISFEFMEDLLSAITDVNDFKEGDIEKAGIQEFIARKKEQAKEEKEKENATPDKQP